MQHAIGGRADEHVGRGGFPGQVLGLGQALMRLHLGELREAAPVGFVAPDLLAVAQHRIFAGENVRIVGVPHAAVNNDFVANFHVGNLRTDFPDDAGCIGTADVEILGVAALLSGLDDVDRDAHRGPHVVVVDPGRLNLDEHLPGPGRRGVDLLDAESLARSPESLDPDHLRGHAPGDVGDHFRGSRVAHGQLLR